MLWYSIYSSRIVIGRKFHGNSGWQWEFEFFWEATVSHVRRQINEKDSPLWLRILHNPLYGLAKGHSYEIIDNDEDWSRYCSHVMRIQWSMLHRSRASEKTIVVTVSITSFLSKIILLWLIQRLVFRNVVLRLNAQSLSTSDYDFLILLFLPMLFADKVKVPKLAKKKKLFPRPRVDCYK